MKDEQKNNQMTLTNVMSGLGALAGLYYAFSNKKGAWAYVGFFIVGGIAGGIIGSTAEYVMKPKAPTKPLVASVNVQSTGK